MKKIMMLVGFLLVMISINESYAQGAAGDCMIDRAMRASQNISKLPVDQQIDSYGVMGDIVGSLATLPFYLWSVGSAVCTGAISFGPYLLFNDCQSEVTEPAANSKNCAVDLSDGVVAFNQSMSAAITQDLIEKAVKTKQSQTFEIELSYQDKDGNEVSRHAEKFEIIVK